MRSFSIPVSTRIDQITSIHCTAMNQTHSGTRGATAFAAKETP